MEGRGISSQKRNPTAEEVLVPVSVLVLVGAVVGVALDIAATELLLPPPLEAVPSPTVMVADPLLSYPSVATIM
jgi:hypothetical protein